LVTSQHLWQIGADEIAAVVQLVRIALWAVPVQLLFSLHHVGSAPVLLDQQRVHSTRSTSDIGSPTRYAFHGAGYGEQQRRVP